MTPVHAALGLGVLFGYALTMLALGLGLALRDRRRYRAWRRRSDCHAIGGRR